MRPYDVGGAILEIFIMQLLRRLFGSLDFDYATAN
jgi:hypothetical protein